MKLAQYISSDTKLEAQGIEPLEALGIRRTLITQIAFFFNKPALEGSK